MQNIILFFRIPKKRVSTEYRYRGAEEVLREDNVNNTWPNEKIKKIAKIPCRSKRDFVDTL
jgi:hypothetical protein